jgi:polar amino acid transport system substrate-binding protein
MTLLWLLALFFGLSVAAVQAEEIPPVIVVGGDTSYPPYEYLDENGLPTGFNVELSQAVARVMGMEVVIRLGPWGEMRQALASGEVDILQGMAYSRERTKEVDFSVPHAVVHQSIWNRQTMPPITRDEDLAGKQVIVMRGSIMHDFMLRKHPDTPLVLTGSLAESLRMLASGRYDCALAAKLPGQYLVDKFGLNNIAPVAKPLIAQDYGYAVKNGNRQLLAKFNEGLAILRQTGEYERIYRKWLGVFEPAAFDWKRFAGYIALLVTPLLLVIGGVVLWSRTLKKEVALRTGELEREVAGHRKTMEELKVRQRQLIQADKMTSLGILVSGVAHEINNPTGLLLLNLPHLQRAYDDSREILEQHYQKHGDFKLGWLHYTRMREEIPQMFREMLDGARRIKRIVEDLKDFARQEDSERMLPVDLNEIVATSLRLVDNSIRKATNHLQVGFAADLPRVRGNHQRIEQVIVNLVLNACQALPDPEYSICLATSYRAESDTVQLVVEDQGEGIAEEHLQHLTDPFFTTRRDSGGTGLGLSISAGIVREHGGSLEFESSPGRGTRVLLNLPAFKEDPREQ